VGQTQAFYIHFTILVRLVAEIENYFLTEVALPLAAACYHNVQATHRYAKAEVSHYIVVDAPAGGHRASLLPAPKTCSCWLLMRNWFHLFSVGMQYIRRDATRPSLVFKLLYSVRHGSLYKSVRTKNHTFNKEAIEIRRILHLIVLTVCYKDLRSRPIIS